MVAESKKRNRFEMAIWILQESSEGREVLKARAAAEKTLTSFAKKLDVVGFGLIIQTASGHVDYYNPRYPPFGERLEVWELVGRKPRSGKERSERWEPKEVIR